MQSISLSKCYNEGNLGSGLMIRDVNNLPYDSGNDNSSNNNSTLKGFEIAGSNGSFVSATARILPDNTVEVSSTFVTSPMYVRYAFSKYPVNPNLCNKEGLPASPFTTK